MPKTCTALVLRCIDFRLGKSFKDYLEKSGLLGDCDIVAAGGGAKNLADPVKPTDPDFILRQVSRSRELHKIKEVILVNHTDCGGYGGKDAFDSTKNETKRLTQDLGKAKSIIQEALPDLKVKTVLAVVDDSKVQFNNVST